MSIYLDIRLVDKKSSGRLLENYSLYLCDAERGFRSAKRCNETHAAQPIRTPGCSASPVAFGYGGQGWGDKEGKGKRKRIEEIS